VVFYIQVDDPQAYLERLAQQHGGRSMSMLLIDCRVQDVVGWRAIFDQDPVDARSTG
jgi:hypothetical protein